MGNTNIEKLRVFEAFAGYGSQSIALRNIGVPYEVVAISEIDKYAIKAYEAIHGPTLNLGDISKIKVEDIPTHDLFTCQDLSVAGKQKGLGEGTRSGLLYECEKIIEHCRPKYLLLENVKNLVGKKFKADFDKWLEYLEGLRYTNYWKVLNAKDYGVPQNRERVFVISILGEHEPFEWPTPIPLDKCIADILEEQIDEKYYLSDELVERFKENINKATDYKQPKQIAEINQVGMLDIKGNEQVRRVYGDNGISPTLNTMQGGNRQPKIITEYIQQEVKVRDNICGTIITINSGGDKRVIEESFKIRKLTPRECFRLMGLNDNEIDKIQSTDLSNSRQYKMAGNSIVINVLEAIFKNLFL